jgi:hypothetical protein
MTATTKPKRRRMWTDFDAEVADYQARNAAIVYESENVIRAKQIEEEYRRLYRLNSPQGKVDRLLASQRAWAQQHAMPYCEADDLDDETWLNYLMRKDERAFAAVMSQLGIDLSNMEHVAWWMRLDQDVIADIFLISQEIIRDEEAGKRKPKI